MPEVYCKILKMNVDGGYCAFICELPETEKKIFYNPFRGIYSDCNFSEKLSEIETVSKTIPTVIKKSESENPEKDSLRIPQSVILKLITVLEGDE
ncbi:MAG: hypothetical protein ACETWM_08060 [Candidatus Lokiarchaeia archaeon]